MIERFLIAGAVGRIGALTSGQALADGRGLVARNLPDDRSREWRRADHPGMRRNLLSPPLAGTRAERRLGERSP
jgi:hypothetical protein